MAITALYKATSLCGTVAITALYKATSMVGTVPITALYKTASVVGTVVITALYKATYTGLYSKHVPIVPVLVESWSGLVNFGSWWPDRASYKNINENTLKM